MSGLCSSALVYNSMASLKWFSWNFLFACAFNSSDLASWRVSGGRQRPKSGDKWSRSQAPVHVVAQPRQHRHAGHVAPVVAGHRVPVGSGKDTCSGEGGERGELTIVASSLASESDFSGISSLPWTRRLAWHVTRLFFLPPTKG